MIEPISCCRKPRVNFTGSNSNNFTGVNSASNNHLESTSARDAYSSAVQDAKDLKLKFTAPQGVGENLNVKA